METLRLILKEHWGYDGFRPLQREAMDCVMAGRDSVVVLPTGGGKSLCFQGPALAMEGMAIVVSPLISLMKDQVDGLEQVGIEAACINSGMSEDERRGVAARIRHGTLKLLYVAPERLAMPRFLDFVKETKISFIAIDEAHCISQWGHDFRPEYRELGALKKVFPGIAFHAYTATATEQVRDDIATELTLANPEVLIGSFDRPNLVYTVKRCSGEENRFAAIRNVILRYPGESGIVYCISRKHVEKLAMRLRLEGHSARPYHAGMDAGDRRANQDAFIREEIDIIVATVAFGMGIDKSNVRYVIHAGMPKSLEHYQQESGRAGRDGLASECHLLYLQRDFVTWTAILGNGGGDGREIALTKLRHMANFCGGVTCRHEALVSYFGQTLGKGSCEACDVCLGHMDQVENATEVAQKIISCVLRLGESFGAAYTAEVLHGSKSEKVLQRGHENLSTWGALDAFSVSVARDWIEQLVSQHVLEKEGEYNIVHVTPLGRSVLEGNETARLLKPPEKKRPKREAKIAVEQWEGVDRGLFDILRSLRLEIARDQSVPAYVVFSDATLRVLAAVRPSTERNFLDCKGVGKKKNREYGGIFRQSISEYCQSNSLDRDVGFGATTESGDVDGGPKPEKRGTTAKQYAYDLFVQGVGLDEVAQRVARAPTTVRGYLVDYILEKGIVEPSPWLSPNAYGRIEEAVTQCDTDRLRPVYDFLQGELSYDDIAVGIACFRNRMEGYQDAASSEE